MSTQMSKILGHDPDMPTKLSEHVPTKVTLDKITWLSLYDRLYDTIRHASRLRDIQDLKLRDTFKDDDVRDEVLNIMNFYFDKGFPVGLTNETEVVIHDN